MFKLPFLNLFENSSAVIDSKVSTSLFENASAKAARNLEKLSKSTQALESALGALQSQTENKEKIDELELLGSMRTQKQETELFQLKMKELDIQSKVQNDMSQQQREYFLQQQIKTIQEELGGVSYEEEIEAMKGRASVKKWDDSVKSHFNKEIGKLQRMNPQVAEYSIQRNYLDLL